MTLAVRPFATAYDSVFPCVFPLNRLSRDFPSYYLQVSTFLARYQERYERARKFVAVWTTASKLLFQQSSFLFCNVNNSFCSGKHVSQKLLFAFTASLPNEKKERLVECSRSRMGMQRATVNHFTDMSGISRFLWDVVEMGTQTKCRLLSPRDCHTSMSHSHRQPTPLFFMLSWLNNRSFQFLLCLHF